MNIRKIFNAYCLIMFFTPMCAQAMELISGDKPYQAKTESNFNDHNAAEVLANLGQNTAHKKMTGSEDSAAEELFFLQRRADKLY